LGKTCEQDLNQVGACWEINGNEKTLKGNGFTVNSQGTEAIKGSFGFRRSIQRESMGRRKGPCDNQKRTLDKVTH